MTWARELTRRTLLKDSAAGALFAALGPDAVRATLAATRRRPGDWPMTARAIDARRWTDQAVDGLREQWRLHLPGGVPGTPALVGGSVYAASFGGDIVAAELATGRERWRRSFPPAHYADATTMVGSRTQGFFAGPAVAGTSVLVAYDRMLALDIATGATRWEAAPLRAAESDDYFWGPPVIAGEMVIAGSGSGAEEAPTRGRVTAYDLSSGHKRWSTATVPPGGNGGGVIGPVTVDFGRGELFAATGAPYTAVKGSNPGTSSLLVLDISNGAVIWQDQVHAADSSGLDLNSAPVLVGSRVFVTAKDGVYAWDRLARRRLWHTQLTPARTAPGVPAGSENGPEGGPIASDMQRVYALSNDTARASFAAAALDPATGKVIWQRSLPGLVTAAPIVAAGIVYTASITGLLHALRADGGEPLGLALLGEPSSCAPAAADGRLVVGTGAAPYLPGDSVICLGA
ncbi:MAG: PQQ-binding-like beta-propeller repeat protein [Gaiellaceae bacterium]